MTKYEELQKNIITSTNIICINRINYLTKESQETEYAFKCLNNIKPNDIVIDTKNQIISIKIRQYNDEELKEQIKWEQNRIKELENKYDDDNVFCNNEYCELVSKDYKNNRCYYKNNKMYILNINIDKHTTKIDLYVYNNYYSTRLSSFKPIAIYNIINYNDSMGNKNSLVNNLYYFSDIFNNRIKDIENKIADSEKLIKQLEEEKVKLLKMQENLKNIELSE